MLEEDTPTRWNGPYHMTTSLVAQSAWCIWARIRAPRIVPRISVGAYYRCDDDPCAFRRTDERNNLATATDVSPFYFPSQLRF